MNLLYKLLPLCLLVLCVSLPVNAEPEGYTLGAGDVVRIHVYDEPDLTFDKLLIGDSGVISFPFLGEITVKGLSLADLEGKLMAGLKPDYLLDPKISLSIVEYRPFYISGEVKNPGSYPFQPGLKLRQAVSLAKGFSERAAESKIYVVHDNDPAANREKVDLSYRVRPGDTITVEASLF